MNINDYAICWERISALFSQRIDPIAVRAAWDAAPWLAHTDTRHLPAILDHLQAPGPDGRAPNRITPAALHAAIRTVQRIEAGRHRPADRGLPEPRATPAQVAAHLAAARQHIGRGGHRRTERAAMVRRLRAQRMPDHEIAEAVADADRAGDLAPSRQGAVSGG